MVARSLGALPRRAPQLPLKAKTHTKAKGTCVIYLRTSSAANVGEDKDSEPRQREKCHAYAERKGLEPMGEFRDPAVSGTDPIISRPGFATMVDYCTTHHVKTILVESGDRFARDLMVQETGLKWLSEVDIRVICVDNEMQYTNLGCTGALVRQMLGAVNEFVAAQDRERLLHGRNKALSKVAGDPRRQAIICKQTEAGRAGGTAGNRCGTCQRNASLRQDASKQDAKSDPNCTGVGGEESEVVCTNRSKQGPTLERQANPHLHAEVRHASMLGPMPWHAWVAWA